MDAPIRLLPMPDDWLRDVPDEAAGPEARHELRESVALAFVAGLQRLSERQRTVLVLRDVLGFRATEVAEMLDASPNSVDSALKRAREALDREHPAASAAALPDSPERRALVDAYVSAQEHGDVEAAVALLSDEAWLTMPPAPLAYQGREAILGFLRFIAGDDLHDYRAVVRAVNGGQPALAWYHHGDPDVVEVLEVSATAVERVTVFHGPGAFDVLGLPGRFPDGRVSRRP